MLLSIRNIRSFALLLCAATFSVATALRGQERVSIAAVGAAAEHGTVVQFVSQLVALKKPVGVILLPKDVRAEHTPLPDGGSTDDLNDAVRMFEMHHQTYHTNRTATDGFVVVPRTPTSCTRVAGLRNSISTTGPIFEVLYRVYRTWSKDGSPEIPAGMVGTSDIYRTVVALDAVEARLQDALNLAIEQVPGLGWALREGTVEVQGQGNRVAEIPACNLALFDGSSWLETSWTLLDPALRQEN